MKKILALVLTLMLVLGAMSALAEVSITINRDSSYADSDPDYARKYTYLKVFDAHKDGTAISYTLPYNSDWATAINNASGNSYFELTANASQTLYYVTAKTGLTDETASAAADWLYALKPSSATEVEIPNATGNLAQWTISGLAEGYYLVIGYERPSGSTNFIKAPKLIAATTNISVTEKNDYPTIVKKQKDKLAATYTHDGVTVQVGDPIYYEVTVDVPANADMPIHVTDVMSVGLTYQADSMLIKVGDGEAAATNANVTAETPASGETWKYEIAANDNTRGKKVVFTFTGIVNDSAVIDTGKKNEVELQYGNTDYKIPDHVEYKIYAGGALKYDGATGTVDADNNLTAVSGKTLKPLDGAEFKLQVQVGKTGSWADLPVAKNTDKNYYYPTTGTGTTIVTPADGKVFFRGLDTENNYRLVETKAPDGYNLMNPPETSAMNLIEDTATKNGSEVTLSSVTDPTLLKVANNTGTTLPSTGGVGTTLFYIGGGILVLAAIILLVTKKRMNAND